MKTSSTLNSIERFGIGEENTFKIKASGKAFKILSDGLYSDKITAIIRELSCNAFDAHVQAGKDKQPFHVHLPNYLEPHFSVRDFGPGLSHEDIKTIYTTYFESTKIDSNEYVGCLGLGSKSPFSYVDSFTIISYYNGKKITYNAYINETGIPTIAVLGEEDSKESCGMEVTFGVQSDDHDWFAEKAQKVYTYFSLKPKVTGVTDYKNNEIKYKKREKDWGIRIHDSTVPYEERNIRGAMAIMGNVVYPLNKCPSQLSEYQRYFLDNCYLDIFFKIGDLEVSASRESISYDKKTTDTIIKRVDEIIEQFRKEVSDRIKSCKTLWDARAMLHTLCRVEYAEFAHLFEKGITWNNEKIESSYVKLPEKFTGVKIEHFQMSWRSRTSNVSKNDVTSMLPASGTKLFYKDKEMGSNARCRQVARNKDKKYGDVSDVYLITIEVPAAKAEFMKTFGLVDAHLIPITSITRDKADRAYVTKPINFCKIVSYNFSAPHSSGCNGYSDCWVSTDADIYKNGIYVPVERYKIHDSNPFEVMKNYCDVLTCVDFDLKKETIYGVKNGVQAQVEKRKNWKLLYKFIEEKINEWLKVGDNGRDYANYVAWRNKQKDSDELNSVAALNLTNLNPKSLLAVFIENVKGCTQHKDIKKFETIFNFVQGNTQIKLDTYKSSFNVDKDIERIYNVYPLIEFLDFYRCNYRTNFKKVFVQYIEKVNELV